MKINDWLASVFSFSKLSTFSRCPRKAFYRNVMKKKEDGADFFLIGRAAHKGQELDNKAKLRGERWSTKQVLDAAVTALEEGVREGGVSVGIDSFAAEHERQLESFEKSGERGRVCPAPGSVEAMFRVGLEVANPDGVKTPASIEGFVDVVSVDERTGRRTVVDYKTGGRPMSAKDAEASLQLGLYATAAGAEEGKIVNFVKGARQKPTTIVTEPARNSQAKWESTLAWFAETISSFRRCLKTGDWPKCDPSVYWCSKTACSFHGLCYPEKHEGLEKLVQVTKIEPPGSLPEPTWRK